MSLTKSQLEQLNNSSFPNNNSGYITPEILRTYNSSSIAATVNQNTYTADSASFDSRIDNIVAGTEYTTTASFNAYTSSTNAFTQSTNAFTQSTNNFTASYFVDSASFSSRIEGIDDDNVTTASFNQYTASNDTKVNNLNTISASYLAFTQSYFVASASFDSRLDVTATTGSNTFNGNQIVNGNVSASSFISASRFVGDGSQLSNITASVSIGILDDGVNKGNATSLNFTGSGISAQVIAGIAIIEASVDPSTLAGYTLTSSFNTYTASQAVSNSLFIQSSQTASMAVSSSTYAITSSYAVNAQTASESRNLVVIARNGNQSTLPAGTVVHITSASGDNPIFNTASFDTELLSANTLGILRSSSTSGADVEVVVNGIVTGVNTNPANGYVAGDVVYLGANGTFTRTQPQAPNQIVVLGQVLRAQQNNGSLYVSINNGWELNELHNVQINGVQTNNLLAYESSSYGLWKNKSIATLGLATTGSNAFTGSQIISGNLSILGNLTAYSASFITVTGSVVVGGNTILLNTFTPAVRYGGMEVVDSGSSGLTGSMLWDSQNDVWLYVNPSGSSYVSARLISGPKSLTLGSEPTLTQNRVPKADDGDHIVDSQISDDGTTVTITNAISASTFVGLGNLTLFSTSVDSRLDNLEGITGSFVTTASFNSFTQSTNTFTASISTSVGLLQTFSGSEYKADSSSFNSRILAATGSTINTGSFVTTGSSATTQTIFGDVRFNTTFTTNNPYTSQNGGTNIVYVDYNDVFNGTTSGNQFIYWINSNFAGVTVNGTGVTNATVTSVGYGATVEINLSTGTTTNGASYTFTGPALQSIDITGSLHVTSDVRAIGVNSSAVMDVNGFYSVTSDAGIQAGASVDGGVYSYANADNKNNNIRLATTSSQVNSNTGPTPFNKPQIAVDQNNNGTFTQISFEGNTDYTNGTITVHQPLFVSQSLSVSGSATFSELTGSLGAFSASVNSRINTNTNNISTLTSVTSSYATTGSNNFIGNQRITGSVIMSSSAAVELQVIGAVEITGSVAGNVSALSVTSNTASIDFNLGSVFTLTIPSSAITYITGSNLKPGQTANIILTQQVTTGSVRFEPTLFRFPSGSINTGSAIASAVDMVSVASVSSTTLYSVTANRLI